MKDNCLRAYHGNTDGEGQAALLLILRSAYSACTSKTPVETLGTVEHSMEAMTCRCQEGFGP